MESANKSKEVRFAPQVSVKDPNTGVEKFEPVKTKSTHRKAKKFEPAQKRKGPIYTGLAAKYLKNNQFEEKWLAW